MAVGLGKAVKIMFYHQWHLKDQGLSLIIEDDDKVAYAYLLRNDSISSDVWLYNVIEPTEQPDWSSPDDMPFLNPRCLSIGSGHFPPLDDAGRIRFESSQSADKAFVRVFIDGQLHAVLEDGAKPGWCRLASVNGALAKRVDEAPHIT